MMSPFESISKRQLEREFGLHLVLTESRELDILGRPRSRSSRFGWRRSA